MGGFDWWRPKICWRSFEMAQLLAIHQSSFRSVSDLYCIKFIDLFSYIDSQEKSTWRVWLKISGKWVDYNLSVFASASELLFWYAIIDFETGLRFRMKIWSFSGILCKDSAPYNPLLLTFHSFEFYSARLLTCKQVRRAQWWRQEKYWRRSQKTF